MTILITNIKELIQIREMDIQQVAGKDMKELPSLKNAYLFIEGDIIIDFGSMENLPNYNPDRLIDADGKMVMPTWCDSHSHLVYAGNREGEFVDRITGLTYEEIAERGGGILNSAKQLQETSTEDLYNQSVPRLKEVMDLGTGALEIKSGYGLTVEAELKMLHVIKKLNENFPVTIKATFLGAHAFPLKYKNDKQGYIDLIINEMLPAIDKENLAEFIDVFCENGYFSTDQTDQIIKAGKAHGLQPKIHVNQFNSIGGVQLAVQNEALSVDHLEILTQEDLESLQGLITMPVALPSCSFFLGIPYTPAREIIDAGLPIALATDYNPGSTPSGNMNFVISTACIKMKMTPEEAINAATINGAFAMNLSASHGSITVGKKANLIITKPIPSLGFLPYAFGSNHIDQIIIDGILI